MTTKIVREGVMKIHDQEGGYAAPDLCVDGESLSEAIAKAVGCGRKRMELEEWAAARRIRARVIVELKWEPWP